MAPDAGAWFTRAAVALGTEPPAVEPGHVALIAWFDQVVARLVDEGHLEPVTVAAGEALPGEGGPVEVSPGAPLLVVDQGGRAYLVRAR